MSPSHFKSPQTFSLEDLIPFASFLLEFKIPLIKCSLEMTFKSLWFSPSLFVFTIEITPSSALLNTSGEGVNPLSSWASWGFPFESKG